MISCYECEVSMSEDFFYVDRSRTTKYTSRCKMCIDKSIRHRKMKIVIKDAEKAAVIAKRSIDKQSKKHLKVLDSLILKANYYQHPTGWMDSSERIIYKQFKNNNNE